MRLLKSMLIAAVAIGLSASAASALVTISHVDSTGGATVAQGDQFSVDVVMGYDGTPTLTGVFVSAAWDDAELRLDSATPSPFAIFFGPGGFLSKVSDPANFPGDPSNTIRTIQHGANPGQSAGAGADTLITTLTFTVVGGLDGTADIDVFFNSGDVLTGAGGAPLSPGTDFVVNNASVSYVPIPEPGTALLMGLGLAGLGFAGRRK